MPPRILPEPTPETRHFWDGCKAGELRLQRCIDCDGGSYFPPRPFCPNCGSRKVEDYAASGRAVLWSYVINMRPRPDMGTEPYAIAVVKLAEGPHVVEVKKTGFKDYRKDIQVGAGSDLTLRVVLEKQ